MPRRAPGEVSNEVLVRYLQGEMTRSESEETERLVADSRRAQARLDELRAMTDVLRGKPDWVASTDLTEAVRERVRAAGPRAARAAPRRAMWLSAGAAAAAVAVVVIVLVRPSRPVEEPRAKGAAGAAADPDRWVGIGLATADGQPVGDRLPPGELMVRYTNLGSTPYSHLMVFAVDAGGEVRWFYPAYQEAGSDPAAIAIEPGVADRLLPDAVEHEFPRGRVMVCGLFLRRAATVREVEAALARRPLAAGERLPFPAAGQHCAAKVVE